MRQIGPVLVQLALRSAGCPTDRLAIQRPWGCGWRACRPGGSHVAPSAGAPAARPPSLEAYEHYRMAVSEDELCKAIIARFNETKCFTQYERTFLVPMFE
jgi:hypothetical protein